MDEYTMSWSDAVRAEAAFAESVSGPAQAHGVQGGNPIQPEPAFARCAAPSGPQSMRLRAIVEYLGCSGVR